MIGTFSPQAEPYTHEMPEDTTPSGLFARGTYSARTKVLFLSPRICRSSPWVYPSMWLAHANLININGLLSLASIT